LNTKKILVQQLLNLNTESSAAKLHWAYLTSKLEVADFFSEVVVAVKQTDYYYYHQIAPLFFKFGYEINTSIQYRRMNNHVEFLVKLRGAHQIIADATNQYIETFSPLNRGSEVT
jgi:hypothetical protein